MDSKTVLLLFFSFLAGVVLTFIAYLSIKEDLVAKGRKSDVSILFKASPLLFVAFFGTSYLFISISGSVVTSLVEMNHSVAREPKVTSTVEAHSDETMSSELDETMSSDELLDSSKEWMNSYEDGKFSTYELYLLSDVQSLTGVKVYDKALALSKNDSDSNQKSFRDLLFKAKRNLNSFD